MGVHTFHNLRNLFVVKEVADALLSSLGQPNLASLPVLFPGVLDQPFTAQPCEGVLYAPELQARRLYQIEWACRAVPQRQQHAVRAVEGAFLSQLLFVQLFALHRDLLFAEAQLDPKWAGKRAEVRLVLPEHHAQRSLAPVFGLDLNPRPAQVALIDRTVSRFPLIRLPGC